MTLHPHPYHHQILFYVLFDPYIRVELYVLEKDDEQSRIDREEKKRYLLRKLSFRPSVDELKNRKVS